MHLSIRKKLMFAFAAAILASILVTCFVLGLQIKNSSITAFHTSAAKELTQIERFITLFINKAQKMTVMIGEHPDVRRIDESIHSYVTKERDILRRA